MKQVVRSLILVAPLVALIGCEGFGNIGSLPNPYSGNLTGTWEDRTRPDDGAIDWDVAIDGVLTGTMTMDAGSTDGDITGTVSKTGEFSGTVDFPVNDITINGTMTTTGSSVTVVFTYTYLGDTYSGTATLSRGS